jgi:diguanylate cyclase (GGDEF)-like protein/PAS domain S-box-containing protein
MRPLHKFDKLKQRFGRAPNRRDPWFEMSGQMLCETDLSGRFLKLNEQWQRALGWSRDDLLTRPFVEFVHPEDFDATVARAAGLADEGTQAVEFESRFHAKDGSWHRLRWASRSDDDRVYAVVEDVTDRERRAARPERQLERERAMARTDRLTGLPNRRAWDEELRRELSRAKRHGQAVTVAIVDLDLFADFNEENGQEAGDELLFEAANSWRLSIRISDYVARIGGEEFGVLFPECPPGDAPEVLERLRAETPFGQSCSAGIAVWDSIESPEQLMGRAAGALEEAKRQGRDRAVLAYP